MSLKFVFALAVVAVGVRGDNVATRCDDRCGTFLNKDGTPALASACQRGCRLYQLSNFNPLFGGLTFFSREDKPLKTCTTDCRSAYDANEKEVNACQSGCQFKKEEGSKNDLFNLGDGGFSVSFGHLPGMGDISGIFDQVKNDLKEQGQIFQDKLGDFGDEVKEKVEDTNEQMADFFNADSIGSVFKRLHQNMKNVMANFMKGSPFVKAPGDAHGGGELTVIKSGPGYHEEKTYHLGPNADIDKIIKSSNMNDMLQHRNPIEKFMDKDQVEVFKPVEVNTGEGNSNLMDIFKAIASRFSNPFAPQDDVGEDTKLDEPKLPENGLRSRHFLVEFGNPNTENFDVKHLLSAEGNGICYGDSSSMSWSDWLSCLHVRLGLPNWLLAATVAMGVLFTLWLCLMIPTNAPKQKVRKQANVDTKEVEAGKVAVVTLTTKDGQVQGLLDLPPSYDDVTKDEKVVVNLEPVHGAKPKIAREQEDDEIAEPLPMKKEDQNQSIV